MKNFLFAFTLLIFCFAGANFGQKKSVVKDFELKGVLKDTNSAVFAGLPLFFNGNGKQSVASTDINGEFSIKLSPGSYEITVGKNISENFVAYINIQENGLNPNNVEFVVQPNQVCCGASNEKPYPKMFKLIKPSYPAAALAVRATGEVVVDIKIDREGKVISAIAISGHPLLRAGSVQAAKKNLFEASENEVERSVKLTYVYLIPENENLTLKHNSNLYRLEVVNSSAPVLNASVE